MVRSPILVILSYFLVCLTCISFPQTNTWTRLQSPTNSTLRHLTFIDSLTGWAAGANGKIIRTTNGGNNWEIQNSPVETFITSIHFVNDMKGWATTIMDTFPFNSIILKTTNGGEDWTSEIFPYDNAIMRTIFFFDSLNGFIGGSYIAYTNDGGESWTRANVDSNMISSFPVYEFNFYNRQFGYACGGLIDIAGVVWRTTDYGLNWSAQGISADEVFDIFIFDSLNAISLSGDPEGFFGIAKLKTTDAGQNWTFESLPIFGLSFATDFISYSVGWSASGYKFLSTTNRGEIWHEVDTPDSSVVYDLQFPDARTGYAVGGDGAILKLKLAYDPASTREETDAPDKFILYQNYPNPFNPSTKIEFQINESGFVTLKVFDVLGNIIATVVNEEKSAGNYTAEFSPVNKFRNNKYLIPILGDLVPGIYFYQLQVGSFVQTKKMVYLK